MIAANPLPHREILWNVPGGVMGAVYLLSACAIAWIAWWFWQRSKTWNAGSNDNRQADQIQNPKSKIQNRAAGLARLAAYLLTHRVILRDPYAGVMHLFIFWGFVVLLIATTLVGIQHHLHVEFLTGTFYLWFSLLSDLGGIAFCGGIGMALWRRRSLAAHRQLLPRWQTTAMLWLLMVVGLTGFLLEGARISRDFPAFEVWSPAGYATGVVLSAAGFGGEAAPGLHRGLWMFHAALVLGFFAIVPVTLLRHLVTGAWSVARPTGHPGVLAPPRGAVAGPVGLPQFRQIDLLQADACLTCGRCTEVCPAQAAGKPLDPRGIVLGLRAHLDDRETPLTAQIADDALWSCTTCNACDTACPVNINVVEKVVTLRRGRVATADIPTNAAESLESAAQKFNPFGRANSARLEWATGLKVPVAAESEPVELLYWVGCGGAFDPAGREVTRAMVRILDHLKVNYRVLGCRERCTGDPARRLGEEGLWQELAAHNRQSFAAHGVQTILTHCPHCFNSFRNEYTALGPMPRVLHHSQWLRDQIAAGRLSLRESRAERVTFHDPCYLARANDEVEAPRDVLRGLLGTALVEMAQHGQKAFCCGGGGGQLWLDVRGATRVETIRAGHVEQTAAQIVATGCPFCRVMLEAGRTSLPAGQGNWRVKDLAELVAERLPSA